MKRIKIDSVMQGDILFTARPGKISKGLRFTTGGLVSHAMICVAHGSFIDSTSDGVQARNLQREVFEDDEQAFHFRLKNPPERQILAQVIDYARAEIGARYSITEAARSVSPVRRLSSKNNSALALSHAHSSRQASSLSLTLTIVHLKTCGRALY